MSLKRQKLHLARLSKPKQKIGDKNAVFKDNQATVILRNIFKLKVVFNIVLSIYKWDKICHSNQSPAQT